jgi:glutathione-independent formaldehyde dehydrogenase
MVSPMGTGKVELLEIEYPKLALGDRKCEHGILKIIATNICGSDQHMVRGRTTAEKLVLGHEITGEVIELERRGIYKERRYCFCSF